MSFSHTIIDFKGIREGFAVQIKHSVKRKSYCRFNAPRHFYHLGNHQSQRGKARFLEKKFLPLKKQTIRQKIFSSKPEGLDLAWAGRWLYLCSKWLKWLP